MRDCIRSGGVGRGALHHLFAQGGIRTSITVQFGLHSSQATIPCCTSFDTDLGGMPFGVNLHALVAIKQQLNRLPCTLSPKGSVDLPGDILLATEATSHKLTDDPHPSFRQAKRPSHLLTVGVG